MANFLNPNFDANLLSWLAGLPPDYSPTSFGLWYKADAITGKSDGDSITTLNDSGPNGQNLTSGGTAPLYKTGIINSLPVIRFGNNGRLDKSGIITGVPSGDSSQTLFTVFKPNSQSDADTIFNYGVSSDNTATHFIYRSASSRWSWDRWGHASEALFDALSNGTPYIMGGRKSGSTRTVYTNGKAGGSNGTAMNISNNGGIQLSDLGINTLFIDGDMGEFISYYGALSTADFADMNSYLALKWGITLTERGGNVTRDTGIKYAGAASAKIVAITDTPFFEPINIGGTGNFHLVAYAYTDGSPVTSADVELFYDGAAQTTVFSDAGGGWYKMKTNISGVNASKRYGVIVKAGKTVYLDSFDLNNQTVGPFPTFLPL